MRRARLTLEVLSPRIFSLRHREEQLEAARDDAETQLEQRRVALPNTEEIAEHVGDFRDFLKDGTFPERKALISNFVEGIEVVGDEATLTYTVPMPNDGVTTESASVLDFVKSGPPNWTRTSGQTSPKSRFSFNHAFLVKRDSFKLPLVLVLKLWGLVATGDAFEPEASP